MQLIARAVGSVAVGVALALSGSPIAHADDASFVRAAKAMGFQYTSTNLIIAANNACYQLGPRRRLLRDVELRIQRYLVAEPAVAHQFLVLAVNEYCPEHAGLVGP